MARKPIYVIYSKMAYFYITSNPLHRGPIIVWKNVLWIRCDYKKYIFYTFSSPNVISVDILYCIWGWNYRCTASGRMIAKMFQTSVGAKMLQTSVWANMLQISCKNTFTEAATRLQVFQPETFPVNQMNVFRKSSRQWRT